MRWLTLLLPLFLLTACFEEEPNHSAELSVASGGNYNSFAQSDMAMAESMPAPMAMRSAKSAAPSSMTLNRDQFNGRRIAETHHLQIEAPRDALQSRYQRDMQKCVALGCELLNSAVYNEQSAHINARIAPEKLGEYLDFLATGEGELKSHQVSADDKTSQYIDTEAKLKNQRAMKERLVRLLDSYKNAKLNDILQVERELTRVQSQIDSLTGQMRALEKVTAKATVNANYSIPPRAYEITYPDVSDSFRYAWRELLQNTTQVIRFIGRIIPWIPIWIFGLWLTVKALRFAFRKSGASGLFCKLKFWGKKKAE